MPDDPTLPGSPYPDDATHVQGRMPAFRRPPPPRPAQMLPPPQVVYHVTPPAPVARGSRNGVWIAVIVCATVVFVILLPCLLFGGCTAFLEMLPDPPSASP